MRATCYSVINKSVIYSHSWPIAWDYSVCVWELSAHTQTTLPLLTLITLIDNTVVSIENYCLANLGCSSVTSAFLLISVAVSAESYLQRGPRWSSLPHIQERGCQYSGKSHSSWCFSPILFDSYVLITPLCICFQHCSITHAIKRRPRRAAVSQQATIDLSSYRSLDWVKAPSGSFLPFSSYVTFNQSRAHKLFKTLYHLLLFKDITFTWSLSFFVSNYFLSLASVYTSFWSMLCFSSLCYCLSVGL